MTVSGPVLSGADIGRLFMATPGRCWATGAMSSGTTVARTIKAKLHRPLQSSERS